MPYRRLPNTDAARIRAMKKALEKGDQLPPHTLAFSSKTLISLRKLLPLFENSIILQRQSSASMNIRNRNHIEVFRKARLYLTHFIKVVNMAIFRGDLSPEIRSFYGLTTNDFSVPLLKTENELLSWGRRIIEGEEFRIKKGGNPITNPTIAVVKVRFEQFVESMNFHNALNKKAFDQMQKIAELRSEADKVILNIWNEVEEKFENSAEEIKRKECEDYGLIYFFRKGEIIKVMNVA
jgi:hypothetical protein